MRYRKILPKVPRPLLLFFSVLILGQTSCWSRQFDRPPVRSWEVLSVEEFQSHDRAHAHFLIQRLRPSWLSGRGSNPFESRGWAGRPSKVRLYVDGIQSTTGIDHLKSIRGEDVQEIRYLNPIDATTRYGTGHSAGAILVTTRAGE